ncbi:MAG: S8 family serine peptidase [Phycisphaerales bacterium]|nr:S8 family serine peptidase [Phycisphaerales bacterium]
MTQIRHLLGLRLLLATIPVFFSKDAGAGAPNDPDFALQWGLQNTGQMIEGSTGLAGADVDAVGAWAIHAGARPVVVAIVGTGISLHEEFADRLLDGYVSSYASSLAGSDPYSTLDTGTNGTRAAGIIAAGRDNGVGIAGLNDRVLLLPVRVAQGGSVTAESVAEGITWAADQHADIILVLVQLFAFNQTLADAVSDAYGRDSLVIAAAGHTGEAIVAYPAAFDDCLAVSATTNQDVLAAFSNYGPKVDLAAPGEHIWSTSALVSDGYSYGATDNSFSAAAFVAGVASLIRSYAPQLNAGQVRQLLVDTADDRGDPGRDDRFGAGRVNARRALETAPAPLLRFEPVDPIPHMVPPLRTTRFKIRIASVAGVLESTSPELVYRTAPGDFDGTVQLEALGGGLYSVPLPPVPCGATLEYYLLATTTQSDPVSFDPPTAPTRLYTASVDPSVPVFADDFETDRGWETSFEGDATTGKRTRVAPVGTNSGTTPAQPVQPGYDRTPDAGRFCFVTGQHFGNTSPGNNDVDGGPVALTSPAIVLGTTPEIEVSYFLWFYTASGTADVLTVQLSRDGGNTWALAETIAANTSGWERHAFRLSDFPSVGGSQLRVRFVTSDIPSPGDSITEAAIDEFRVDAVACNVLPGDADWDGDVDLGDIARLGNCFVGPGAAIGSNCRVFDADGDSDVDFEDVRSLMNGFSPEG